MADRIFGMVSGLDREILRESVVGGWDCRGRRVGFVSSCCRNMTVVPLFVWVF